MSGEKMLEHQIVNGGSQLDACVRILKTGSGRYIHGPKAIGEVGKELRRLGYSKVGVLSGNTAFEVGGEGLQESLEKAGILFKTFLYSGFCTDDDIDTADRWTSLGGFDCLIGLGGGKVMDYAKAVAAQTHLPVFTIPTIAATCAAFAPLSVIYDGKGRQQSIRYHTDSVSGVFIDMNILAKAPARYLAAGIADSFAKHCEYTSMHDEETRGELGLGRFLGASLASRCNEVLLDCSREAYADNLAHIGTSTLSDAVACIIGVIGVVGGFGAFTKQGTMRFAIAHGMNEVIRGRHVPDPSKYLHGEIVGVGIMAQLRASDRPSMEIMRVEKLFMDLHLPTRLAEIDMIYDDTKLDSFIEELVVHCHIESRFVDRVTKAIRDIR